MTRAILIVAWLVAGHAVAGQPVGSTTTTFTPDAGVKTFTDACNADFGGTARMCTSEELLLTAAWPTLGPGGSWVMPVLIGGVVDASGQVGGSCEGWTGSGLKGLIVTADGSFSVDNCSSSHPVACCLVTPTAFAPAFPGWAMWALVTSLAIAGTVLVTRRRTEQSS